MRLVPYLLQCSQGQAVRKSLLLISVPCPDHHLVFLHFLFRHSRKVNDREDVVVSSSSLHRLRAKLLLRVQLESVGIQLLQVVALLHQRHHRLP